MKRPLPPYQSARLARVDAHDLQTAAWTSTTGSRTECEARRNLRSVAHGGPTSDDPRRVLSGTTDIYEGKLTTAGNILQS